MLNEDTEKLLEKINKEINEELGKRLKQNGIVTGKECMELIYEKLGLRLNLETEYGFDYCYTLDENLKVTLNEYGREPL